MINIKTLAATGLMLLALFSFSSTGRAGDDGLYAAAPPLGSAFIRFVNGDADHSYKGNVRGKQSATVAPGHAGPYLAVAQGEANVGFGSVTATYTFKPGGHYSAVLTGGHLNILDEPANDNKLKTQLVLINLSGEKQVSLKTPDGNTEIINAVDPGNLGARPVNPVKTGFAVYSGNNKIASLNEQSLERGASYAIVVYKNDKGIAANYDKATGL